MKVAHLNTLEYGGAAVVSRRLHTALLRLNVNSLLVTKYRMNGVLENHHFFKDIKLRGFIRRQLLHPRLHNVLKLLKRLRSHPSIAGRETDRFEIFSPLHREQINNQYDILNDVDIIHLHWVNDFIDYSSFFQHFSDKKFVWTLHDMNPFTGGCHHSDGCTKFLANCFQCPQLEHSVDPNYSNKVLQAKIAALSILRDDQLIIVSPSKWLSDLSKTSRIMNRFHHEIIPNPAFDIQSFSQSRRNVREELKLPLDKKIVLFASDNLKNPRKGIHFLFHAVRQLTEKNKILLLGIGHKAEKPSDLDVEYTGNVSDSRALSEYFYSSDVFVTPTVAENSPLVVIESLCCGTPVIGSCVGGIPDLINSQNGLLFPTGDVKAIAESLQQVLFEKNFDRQKIMSAALKVHKPVTVAQKYKYQIYNRIMSQDRKKHRSTSES